MGDYQSNVGVGFTFNPTISVSLSDSDLTIDGLIPGGGAADSNVITVDVSTNTAYGYTLTSTVGASNTTRNLVNSVDNTKTFASIDFGSGLASLTTDNTWGYSYSSDNGTTWANYSGLPLYGDSTHVATLIDTDDAADSDSIKFKIAAKAGATQASGEYTNVVNFAAVANAIPATLYDAFAASGAVMANGYYKMQDMTSSICNAAEGESWLQLVDTRDNKLYWVAKLADGHCWMTQNLDFDIEANTILNSNTTDLNVAYDSSTGQYAEYNDGYTESNGIISWTPQNTTKHSATGAGTNWTNSYNVAYSLDPGEWYWDGDDSTTACDFLTDATCSDESIDHFSRSPYSGNGTHGSVGNYYNWSAAIASDGSSSLSSSTYNNITLNPQNSICPKGWRLPTISNVPYTTVNSTSEFGRLNQLYNGGGSTDPKLISAPLWFVRSGYVNNGSLYGPGSGAYYWSSTVVSSIRAYSLYFAATGVNPANRNFRYYGWSVRCVAR